MSRRAFIIRQEARTDGPGIDRVHYEAFPTRLEADLVAALRKDGVLIVSLVAMRDDEVVGHVAFSQADDAGLDDVANIAWLAPIGVLPDHQRQGIGSALIQAGVEACRTHHLDGIVVVGAQTLYGRFGFNPEAARSFDTRFAGPHLMALAFGEGALSGTLTEPRAFSSLA
jgi:putative acetyltransferase